jgi:hypothetical protein
MMRALRSYLTRRSRAASRAAIIAQAQDRLTRMVEERRNSFEIQDYRKRREAALKGRAAHAR